MRILDGVEHGTNAGYLKGCKCLACCDAHAEYRREQRAGRGPSKVDAAPARAYIQKLRRRGYSLRAIAKASGRWETTVRYVANGSWQKIGADLEADILAVCAPPRTANVRVPAVYAHRILNAARKAGVSRYALEKASGRDNLSNLGERSVEVRTLERLEGAARALGVRVTETEMLALDASRLAAAPVRPQDEATARAYSRAMEGRKLTLAVAQRVCRECGLDLEEAIAS